MQIDWSGVEQFLSYVDGEASLSDVWEHPAYERTREHAELLGRDFTPEDIERAMAGERTAFTGVQNLEGNREQISQLLEHISANETAWTDEIERQLHRLQPDESLADVTVFLGIGYDVGIGLENGAYINLNEPLFFEMPRQLLYTAIHESSHVLYEREHHSKRELGPNPLAREELQFEVFNTVFHTEAYATYAPLSLRRADGNLGVRDHPMAEDYAVLADDERMQTLVEKYDDIRETLREGSVSRKQLFSYLFSEPRVPYRVGCALLDGIEDADGIAAVRDGFSQSPMEFCEAHDWVLDEYRVS